MSNTQDMTPGEDLYWRLHGLSKILEGSGLIDESQHPDAYSTILDAMAFVRGTPHPDVASGYADGWQDGMSEATQLLTEEDDSKLVAQQPGVRELLSDCDEDAAMYRWLRAQHEDDSGEWRCCVFAPNDMRECLVPVGDMPGELDAFIRAAMAAQGGRNAGT